MNLPSKTKRNKDLMDGFTRLTVLVHGRLKALGQATGATLIAMRLVHGAASLQITRCLAGVYAIAMNAALEETRAACRKKH